MCSCRWQTQGVVDATRKAESKRVRRPVSRVLSSPESDGWPFLWDARYRTPHATDPGGDAETPLPVARRAAPIWSCSRWGLPCRFRCRSRGGLLPHRFTLAGPANRAGGLFSVALSLGSPPPDVIRHRVSVEPGLSSSRFRRNGNDQRPSGHLTRQECNSFAKLVRGPLRQCAIDGGQCMKPGGVEKRHA